MKPVDRQTRRRSRDRWLAVQTTEDRRQQLVREMVAGAILPGLLARKDAGVFDRGPNVLRLRERCPAE